MDKNLPANARHMHLTPGLGRSHMPWRNYACVPQLLNPLAAASEAHVPRPCAPQQEGPSQQAAHALSLESNRCSLPLEKARVQQWGPSAVKNKIKKLINWKKGFFIEMSCGTAIPLWGIYPKEMESDLEEIAVLPSSLQHYSQKYGNNLCCQWVGA